VTATLNARGDVAVLVPAAGAGLRLGPGGPKALRQLAGEPLLVHAIRRVAAAPSVRLIVVAAPAAELEAVRELLAPVAPVTVVAGGAERQESVALALAAVPAEVDIVLVHDAARALTPPQLIESVAAAIRGGHPAVIPVLPVIDTIKKVGPAPSASALRPGPSAPSPHSADLSEPPSGASMGAPDFAGFSVPPSGASMGAPDFAGFSVPPSGASVGSSDSAGLSGLPSGGLAGPAASAGLPGAAPGGSVGSACPAGFSEPVGGHVVWAELDVVVGTVDRAVLRNVQTPQGFRRDVLVAAHAAAVDPLTDDAGLVEKAGVPVACVPGSELAMKITRPLDLILAEALLHVT
jgi:2-C-methyl-D-erythritol 4-phosphate cytidylyltransferase